MTNNPGLVIAAPASGSGKTVLTLGLLRHLASMGRNVASAKTGPDYIDPAFHAAATGRPCLNLDPWAMRPDTLAQAAFSLAREADVVICEGVMGLFDGAFVGKGEPCGSTADLSRATGWPVVLVIDAGAQAASAAAVLKGFATFEAGVEVLGVVFNRVGSERHGTILRDACAQSVAEIPVLGCLPRTPGLELPERHLGLVQAGEHKDLEGFLDRAGAWVAEHLDVDGLVALARPLALSGGPPYPSLPPMAPLGQRIAVAADPAFAFSYPLSSTAGATLGRRSCRFRRSPAKDRMATPTLSTCRGGIRSFTPVPWLPPAGSWTASPRRRRAAPWCSANAAAIWFWAAA